MATMAVMARGEFIEFDSPMSNLEALAKLKDLPRASDFARDLAAKADQGLSERQWAWVHKLVIDAERPAPEGVDADLSKLVALFETAAKRLKYPKITFDIDGQTIQLSLAGGRSQRPGTINVTDGQPFGMNRWYGRIEKTGTLSPGRALTDAVRGALKRLADDPAGFGAAHGHRTGNCCFCAKTLSDERSVAVGYGPKCASNWSLPWG